MKEKYFPPVYLENKFHCPICHVFSSQRWDAVFSRARNAFGEAPVHEIGDMNVAFCIHCRNYTIWHDGIMIFPDNTGVQLPNDDLPEDITADYLEAASIVQKSPRGAAALLRLAIQKLCKALGEKGKNIDDDISSLVKKGLPVQVQQALDIVRVIGNESVHPGSYDLKDDPATASQLFALVNLIADIMISQPKHVEAMYKSLPAGKLKGIEDRDKKRV